MAHMQTTLQFQLPAPPTDYTTFFVHVSATGAGMSYKGRKKKSSNKLVQKKTKCEFAKSQKSKTATNEAHCRSTPLEQTAPINQGTCVSAAPRVSRLRHVLSRLTRFCYQLRSVVLAIVKFFGHCWPFCCTWQKEIVCSRKKSIPATPYKRRRKH